MPKRLHHLQNPRRPWLSRFAGLAAIAAAILSMATASASAQSSVGCSAEMAVGATSAAIDAAHVGMPGFVLLSATRGDYEFGYLSPTGWVADDVPAPHQWMLVPALPNSFRFDFCLPEFRHSEGFSEPFLACSQTSFFAAGFELHVTYGALTPAIEAAVAQRAELIGRRNAQLIELGRSPVAFDRERWIDALVMREARERVQHVMTIPPGVDCRPPDTGGGN